VETRHIQLESFLGIKLLAAAAVLALIVVAFAQGYSKISKGSILSARNTPLAPTGIASSTDN
jgi:hypothetical protein